ncbi:MAG: RNA methyltransferase [Bacteroidales bacterium]|nr:RNA methyltransferase [Bacteroidales bacterium]MBQ9255432.1 RNA methyltransferase [Bacteroidales bacterium]
MKTYENLNILQKKEFYENLCTFITPERKSLIERNIDNRTNWFVPVIENIHKAQNASAVLRTCDCLGLQDVMVVENNNTFEVTDDISLGANKWLNIKKYNQFSNNTKQCFDDLRKKGYKIIATMPYKNDINLQDIDINEKCAIVFGSEVDGISQQAIENADCFMKIPMYGFTESFNISVSAAITLHYLTDKLRNSNIDWHLDKEEQTDILVKWALKSVKYPDKIEKEIIQRLFSENK